MSKGGNYALVHPNDRVRRRAYDLDVDKSTVLVNGHSSRDADASARVGISPAIVILPGQDDYSRSLEQVD